MADKRFDDLMYFIGKRIASLKVNGRVSVRVWLTEPDFNLMRNHHSIPSKNTKWTVYGLPVQEDNMLRQSRVVCEDGYASKI